MKNPVLVFIGLLLFAALAALVALVWAPSWTFGLGAGLLGGGLELGGGLLGLVFGIGGAILGVLAAIVAAFAAIPLALLTAIGGILLALAIVAAVLLGLAAPILVPVLMVLALVWIVRRSGPRPPVPSAVALPPPTAA